MSEAMSTEDAVELVTKMTIGPTDVIVVRCGPHASLYEVASAFRDFGARHPQLNGVPIVAVPEDIDIEKLDDREARRLYDVLRKRFEGAK